MQPSLPRHALHHQSTSTTGLAVTVVLCAAFTMFAIPFGPSTCLATDPVTNPVTFERNVMAVLSKGGCNAGTCHGNINGKGGFFLSLRGQDPSYDYMQMVHDADGRRVNRISPADSLLLLKATARVAHQGGKRFAADSPEYETIERWIRSGVTKPNLNAARVERLSVTPEDVVLWAPNNELTLQVTAHFSDGHSEDVTRMAVYEPSDPLVTVANGGIVHFENPGIVTVLVRYLDGQSPVRIAYRTPPQEFSWHEVPTNNYIDEIIFKRLQQVQINPATLSSDSVFLRRLYLDLLGILPTAETAQQFVNDQSPDKREKLVDQLLERNEFAEMWALKWSDIVRNEEKTLDATGVTKLHHWMRDWFAADKPLNEFAKELIAARGSTYENPPANYWRAHREPFVRAETTAQVFLGVRLQCAKCHNHPFDRWTQDEYYQWGSLFAGIDYEIVENKRKDSLDKHEFVGDQIVKISSEATVKNVRTGNPAEPRFLGDNSKIEGDRLEQLAEWLSSSDNKMFARAQANRVWYHLMGAALVDPVDDLRATNPPSHPELLDRLADELIDSNYSLKYLVKTIVLSRTYQLGAELSASEIAPNEYDERLFARAVMKRLTAEQILDAQSHILGIDANFEGYEIGTRAGQIAGVERVRRKLAKDDVFLRQFGKPERLLACECERSDQPTLGQALSLVGGENLNRRLSNENNRIGKLLQSSDDPKIAIEQLFWTALTRPATEQELSATLKLIEDTGDPRTALEDLMWALLNAKELLFRN